MWKTWCKGIKNSRTLSEKQARFLGYIWNVSCYSSFTKLQLFCAIIHISQSRLHFTENRSSGQTLSASCRTAPEMWPNQTAVLLTYAAASNLYEVNRPGSQSASWVIRLTDLGFFLISWGYVSMSLPWLLFFSSKFDCVTTNCWVWL